MASRNVNRKSRKAKKAAEKAGLPGTLYNWLLVAFVWAPIAVGLLVAWYAKDLPAITQAMSFERRPSIAIKGADGTLLQSYGETKGQTLGIEDIPSHLIYAVMAIEDRRFYQHFGIDPVGLARAVFVNLKSGAFRQGGSTITQQLAKNLFLTRERTIKRKIQEALLALWLERILTKDEILSAYLNRVYLGAGAYGVDAAARLYFNKPASGLSLGESALLAGLLKAPSRYAPTGNPALAIARAKTVLQAMESTGYIEPQDLVRESHRLQNLILSPHFQTLGDRNIRYFTDYALGRLNELTGAPAARNIVLHTTLDPQLQLAAHKALEHTLRNYEKPNMAETATNDKIQGAIILLRMDGAVAAMVGGRNYRTSQFNRVTDAYRAPGSAFKPVIYLTALERGWEPGDIVTDAPIATGQYRPRNFNERYVGEVTLTEALALSLNSVSVRLMREIGAGPVLEMARRLGISAQLERDLSLALGSGGLTPLELAGLYGVIARGGFKTQSYAITKITSADESETYYQREKETLAVKILDRKLAEDMTEMLRSVIGNGTGQAARTPFPAAGKTGTSQDFRDAWFVGFTGRYIAAVWLGHDDNAPMDGVTGGSLPAQIWRDVMIAAHAQEKSTAQAYKVRRSGRNGFQDLLARLGGRPRNTLETEKENPQQMPARGHGFNQ